MSGLIKGIFLILLSSLISIATIAQELSNLKEKWLIVSTDSLQLDTLSIVPGTFNILIPNDLDSSSYELFPSKALLVWSELSEIDSVKVRYRTYPFYIEKPFFKKDPSVIIPIENVPLSPFAYDLNSSNTGSIDFGDLDYSGSFNRGISFGNTQDLVVNSNFNIQFGGVLQNDVEVLAAISDNSLPIQPEGNTSQLQEFDKIFVQFKKDRTQLTLGDFIINKKPGYFLNYNRKLQGLDFSTATKTKKEALLSASASAALAKGKFVRNQFEGEEGNQGPYKLKGENGEIFIIILSGSERVFLDGVLMERGTDKDYVIDYNFAEIRFTARRHISINHRIAIEFEYSEQYYQKTLLKAQAGMEKGKFSFDVNFYNEQDSKNTPIQGDYPAEIIEQLTNVGDNLSDAFLPGARAVPFDASQVTYALRDSTVNGQVYDSIYVYSVDSTETAYAISFSDFGNGNGNYVIGSVNANGRVYEWSAPDSLSGQMTGRFEPIIQLISPKQKQLITLSSAYKINEKNTVRAELALSQTDLNTFSKADSENDFGTGLRTSYENIIDVNKRSRFRNTIGYEFKQKNFNTPEIYRPVEFSRDWNLREIEMEDENEHWLNVGTAFEDDKYGYLKYRLGSFVKSNVYDGLQHYIDGRVDVNGFRLESSSSFLNSSTEFLNSTFRRPSLQLSKSIAKLQNSKVGVQFQQEDNQFRSTMDDLLQNESFKWNMYTAFISMPDTMKYRLTARYSLRDDFRTKDNNLTKAFYSNTIAIGGGMGNTSRSRLNWDLSFRDLRIEDSELAEQNDQKSILGLGTYSFQLWQGAFRSATLYEVGSGQEQKVEFTYVEVEPGQGQFSWTDYNMNGFEEENEFEISAYADSARFVRLSIPTDVFIRTNNLRFNQSFTLKPDKWYKKGSKKGKFIRRFSYNGTFQIEQKTSTDETIYDYYNPFFRAIPDSNLVTSNVNLRNVLSFNRSSSKLRFEIYRNDVAAKIALINGADGREKEETGMRGKWNISRALSMEYDLASGHKRNSSIAFIDKNYDILFQRAELGGSYTWNQKIRAKVTYSILDNRNTFTQLSDEFSRINRLEAELKFTVLRESSLANSFTFSEIEFFGVPNSSLGFVLLESLQPGSNFQWSSRLDRNFKNNINLGISYEGRQLGESPIKHVMRANMRAIF